ncbi:MAG: hypothetical protein FP826_13190 [Sphingomonadales bacterium]|nr:hypothetical protein [Sphingomonadales bacterium]MBU3993288.1 hypothetical protein [Alphaproteobacteria bacterium]
MPSGTPVPTGLGAAAPLTVDQRANMIASSNSPLMKAAETRGLQTANRRGLGNSSMAAQASQMAVLDAAVPIASKDADIALGGRDLASRERTGLASTIAQVQSNRLAAVPGLYTNPDLPASARTSGLDSLNQVSNDTIAYLQNLYGYGAV